VHANYEYGKRKVTKTAQKSAMVLRMKSLGFIRIVVCSKYEWNSEWVWASWHVANMNEAQIECSQATQQGDKLLDTVEKMCPMKLRFYK
jgi:hypothetical protein